MGRVGKSIGPVRIASDLRHKLYDVAKMSMTRRHRRFFLGVIYEVFEVSCRLVAIATVCASTKTTEAGKRTHGLFFSWVGFVTQTVCSTVALQLRAPPK